MASITDISAAQADLANMTIQYSTNNVSTAPKMDPKHDTAEYWTSLLLKNLAIAQTTVAERSITPDSDDGAALLSQVDENIMNAPRRKSTRDALAREIAARLYPAPPESLAPIIKYEKDVVMLRAIVLDQRRSALANAIERNARHTWVKRISEQGPWNESADPMSLAGAPSLPMPVKQSDEESLAPFFAHLAADGTHAITNPASKDGVSGFEPYYDIELLEFEKGVLYADGRIDLCKMVTGPRNIGALMEALKSNTFSKHFLLGNNIIGPTGAKAIASFIDQYPGRFETWYLAGNCIDTAGFNRLVDSMIKSPVITNVWLKRNPLGSGAAKDVFRLITQTSNLRTLDLDQTELGDAGIAELFELLSNYSSSHSLALHNFYMNACGIGVKACTQITKYLQAPNCTIEALYMSNNPIGDAATLLATGLKANKSLKRLSVQSCGLNDNGMIAVAEALKGNNNITALDIGQAYATEDLGMRYNWITNASTAALVGLINTTNLQYLNLSYTPMSQSALTKILDAVSKSPTLVWFHTNPLVNGGKTAAEVKAGQEYARVSKVARERLHQNVEQQYGMDYQQFEAAHKRFLISPKDIRHIDSVYRNRDAGAARRGLKRLEKWWDEDDTTLEQVQLGTLE